MALDIRTGVTGFGFDHPLTLDDAAAIVAGRRAVAPSASALARCAASHARLVRCIDEARHVYGVTTGFGPLANRLVSPDEAVTLQQNLVHHLATGLGQPFNWATARAIVLARLSSIMQGASGASPGIIDRLVALLNGPFAPVIPERGTVGASGDLTPLAHMVLAFQGRGAFLEADGTIRPGREALDAMGLAPLDLGNRDGLALVNGTSAMTGIALVTSRTARRLADWSVALSAALMEVLGGRLEAWSPAFARLRPHPGQIAATEALNARLRGSLRALPGHLADRRLGAGDFRIEAVPGQDAYTLRCVPQVLGAVLDALRWHDEVLAIELNAVTDNPVFPDEESALALHGGNFMGQHVAQVSDALACALTTLAGLAERQVARLTDEKLNAGLPAFLHRGAPGLNSGFMGAQVTATATLAEMRSHGPAAIHSISTNGANQDVVSMGTIAARKAALLAGHLAEILAIEALCVAQAVDLRQEDTGPPFAPATRALLAQLRAVTAPVLEDRPLAPDIVALAGLLRTAEPAAAA